MRQKRRHALSCLKRIGLALFILLVILVCGISGLVITLVSIANPVNFDNKAAQNIHYHPWRKLIPGPGLPEDLAVMAANNNLDVVHYRDYFYIAFRTAPTHFASEKTRLVILRSADRLSWEKAGEFQLGCDLREPRFLVFQDTLFLYYYQGGTHPLKFEPQQIYVTTYIEEEGWTEPAPVYKPGYVVWRLRNFGDTAYMSVYYGAGLYTTGDRPGDLRLLVSRNGCTWQPISENPQVDRVSAEEGEFCFDAEGNLYATVRLETGGALVCHASKYDLSRWTCTHTDEKYDSALMFRHGVEFYVIARRNVAGPFASGADWLPKAWQRGWWMLRYSLTRKRTTLYRLDTTKMALLPVLDFPSKGDTAFAGIVELDENSYWLANYSCSLDGPDWPWIIGQIAGTTIYDTQLHFEEKETGGYVQALPNVGFSHN